MGPTAENSVETGKFFNSLKYCKEVAERTGMDVLFLDDPNSQARVIVYGPKNDRIMKDIRKHPYAEIICK